ncbi:hypothetical protein TNCV_4427081 [Trichonephila clavipes]|nr:hypothetical protein TNCV_4427081 [Trichonephila clavipes]
MLGRRIAARQYPPACLPELRRALPDEWCYIPKDHINNLILSMPRRFPCLNCGGGDRWRRHLSSPWEFLRAKSYGHLHGAQG